MKPVFKKKAAGLVTILSLLAFLPASALLLPVTPQEKPVLLSQRNTQGITLIDNSSSTADLVQALQHSSLKYQRRYAAQLLGEKKEAEGVPYLVQALEDPEDIVQKAAAQALAKIGDTTIFPLLLQKLDSPKASIREYSAYVLGRLAEKEDDVVVRALESKAADQDTKVRIEVIYALYEIGSPSSTSIFINGLHDPEPRIRSYCANALGNLRVADAGAALSQALDRETDENVLRSIVSAVGKIGGSSSARTLAEAITNEAPSLRADIADALAEIKTPEATQALIDLLSDSSLTVRSRAAAALAKVRDPASIGPLAVALKDRSPLVRRPASDALTYVADSSIIEDLVAALGDSDPVVAENAARALVRVNDLDSVHVLIDALGSANQIKTARVLSVLEEITHRPYGADIAKWIKWYEENFKLAQ